MSSISLPISSIREDNDPKNVKTGGLGKCSRKSLEMAFGLDGACPLPH
jgi:hypothetical protein